MARIISFFNQAGGVGKTTLVMNIGFHLAKERNRVLLVDMDPQASLTLFMGLSPREVSRSAHQAIVEGKLLPVNFNIHRMDLAPTNLQADRFEEKLSLDGRWKQLRELLQAEANDYDFVLIDCPPSKGVSSKLSLVAASHLVIPVATEFKGLAGTDQLLETVAYIRQTINPQLEIAAVIPTMFDGRTRQHQSCLEDIESQLSKVVPISPPIPKSIAFADASSLQVPLAGYDPKHPAVDSLQMIAKFLQGIGYRNETKNREKAVSI